MITAKNIALKDVAYPAIGAPETLPELSQAVYAKRLERVLAMMREHGLDCLALYADREHYSNFEYVAGFDPRFEEAMLLLGADGKASCLLGNECLNLTLAAQIPMDAVLCQMFSLPNQPIDKLRKLEDIYGEFGLGQGSRVGVVGWKLMHPIYADKRAFDVPAYVVEAFDAVCGADHVENATDKFIHPGYGLRILNTADDIACFEYGAAWASEALKDMLDGLKTGVSELDISRLMKFGGIPLNSHPLITVGERIVPGLVTPSNAKLELGERFNCSLGLRGGLSCRSGYLAYAVEDIPEASRDYLDVLVKPYYATVANWYEGVKIGAKGSDIFGMVQSTFPKEHYGWTLNTGHFIGTEEWLSSPFYAGSDVVIQSGMCIQMDIIPSMKGYAGANCEDGIAIADAALRKELAERFPEVYARIERRRRHMIDVLHIDLPDEALPLSNLAATYRPLMLNKNLALVIEK